MCSKASCSDSALHLPDALTQDPRLGSFETAWSAARYARKQWDTLGSKGETRDKML